MERIKKIFTSIKEFKQSQQSENKEKKFMIDKKTHFVDNYTATRYIEIRKAINILIEQYKPDNVYIGKTCNPHGRMTGDYGVSESVGESLPEDFETPPHDKPHIDNNYGKMFLICETSELKDIIFLEKKLIKEFRDRTRNTGSGGTGRSGSAPWYIYVVVQNSAL